MTRQPNQVWFAILFLCNTLLGVVTFFGITVFSLYWLLLTPSWRRALDAILVCATAVVVRIALDTLVRSRVMRRIKSNVLDPFPTASFREFPVREYLDPLGVPTTQYPPLRDLLRNGRFIVPEHAQSPDYGDVKPPYVRVIQHASPIDAIGPTPYFAFDALFDSCFIFTSVKPTQLSGMRTFFILHEIGHGCPANRVKNCTAARAVAAAIALFSAAVSMAITNSVTASVWAITAAFGFAAVALVLAWHSALARERISDIFALAFASDDDVRTVQRQLNSRPALFYDDTLSRNPTRCAFMNKERLEWLRICIDCRLENRETFVNQADLRTYSISLSNTTLILCLPLLLIAIAGMCGAAKEAESVSLWGLAAGAVALGFLPFIIAGCWCIGPSIWLDHRAKLLYKPPIIPDWKPKHDEGVK